MREGVLSIATDPPEATVEIDGVDKGYTPIDIPIPLDPDEYRKKVTFRIYYELAGAFRDKTRHKTIRPGMVTRYLTRLTTIARVRGTTKKDNVAKEATFTMWVEDRKTRAKIPNAQLYLLNMTNMAKAGSLIMPGSYITIPYSDKFFAEGKNRLVCYWGDTGDRIRAFRTITIPTATGDSIDTEEDWHEENDDTNDVANDIANSIDAAYARIGK